MTMRNERGAESEVYRSIQWLRADKFPACKYPAMALGVAVVFERAKESADQWSTPTQTASLVDVIPKMALHHEAATRRWQGLVGGKRAQAIRAPRVA